MHSLSRFMPKITENCLGKKGLIFGRLLKQWPEIIGRQKARMAIPSKLSFHHTTKLSSKPRQATLTLSTTSSYATLLNHEKRAWIEKINLFLGYDAIKEIKFTHDLSPLSGQTKIIQRQTIDPDLKEMLEEIVSDISDEDLRQALFRYGCSLQKQETK